MTVMPLYGFVQGDTMMVVVLARLEETVRRLGDNLLRAVGVRVARRGAFTLMAGDRRLDLDTSLAAQGLQPLERVDLVWES
jgi:hypothetical protein